MAGIRMKLTVMSDYSEYSKRTRGGPGEDCQLTIGGRPLETNVDSHPAVFRDAGCSVWRQNVHGFHQLWRSASDDWAKSIWVEP